MFHAFSLLFCLLGYLFRRLRRSGHSHDGDAVYFAAVRGDEEQQSPRRGPGLSFGFSVPLSVLWLLLPSWLKMNKEEFPTQNKYAPCD